MNKDVVIEVRGDLADVNRKIAGLERRMTDTKKHGTRAFDAIGKSLSALGSAAVAAAGVAGLGYLVKRQLEAADAIGKTADKIGLTTEQLQKYQYAGKLAGVNQRTLNMAMQRFSRRMGEAAQGTGEALKTVEQYGFQVRNSSGAMRSNTAILSDWADVIRNAESEQERLRIAFKLFDSEGAAVVNMLRDGSGALNATMKEASALGLVMDRDLIGEATEANDEITKLSAVLKTRFTVTLAELAPHIRDIAEDINNWIKNNQELLTQDIPAALGDIASAAKEVAGWIDDIARGWTLIKAFQGDPLAAQSLLNDFQDVGEVTNYVRGNISDIVDETDDAGKAAKKVGIDFKALGKQVEDAFDAAKKSQEAAIKEGERLNEQTLQLTENYVNMGDELEKALGDPDKYFGSLQNESEETAEKQIRDTRRATSEMEQIWDTFLDRTQGAFADTFYDILDDGISDWEDFTDRVGDLFKRMLAEMAAYAAMQKIVIPVFTSITGGGGLFGGGAAGGLLGGGGNPVLNAGLGYARNKVGQSLISRLTGNYGGYGSAWNWAGAGLFSSGFGMPGAASAAATYVPGAVGGVGAGVGLGTPGGASAANIPAGWGLLGSSLMAGGIGAMAYNPIAGITGLPTSGLPSSIGAGLGAAGGFALGAQLGSWGGPIGAIAGGLLGGIGGSFFGDEPEDPWATWHRDVLRPGTVRSGTSIDIYASKIKRGHSHSDPFRRAFAPVYDQATEALEYQLEMVIAAMPEEIGSRMAKQVTKQHRKMEFRLPGKYDVADTEKVVNNTIERMNKSYDQYFKTVMNKTFSGVGGEYPGMWKAADKDIGVFLQNLQTLENVMSQFKEPKFGSVLDDINTQFDALLKQMREMGVASKDLTEIEMARRKELRSATKTYKKEGLEFKKQLLETAGRPTDQLERELLSIRYDSIRKQAEYLGIPERLVNQAYQAEMSDLMGSPGSGYKDYMASAWPGYQHGIASVPKTGPAVLHEGERVISREDNDRLIAAINNIRGGGPQIHIHGPVTTHNLRKWFSDTMEDVNTYRYGNGFVEGDVRTKGLDL